ncbi:MAG: efflux RND transporter permease subunit [Planctomycetota bacterium]
MSGESNQDAAASAGGLSTIYYRNPRLVVLTVALISVAGLSSFQVLPRLEDPLLVSRVALVTTSLPGAPPERVEALVTEPIEDVLTEIEEIKEVESTSSQGTSLVVIELKDEVLDGDPVWSRVRDKLGDVTPSLPPGTAPAFDEIEVRGYAMLVALTWQADRPPLPGILRRLAKDLQDKLEAVPGTEEVERRGEAQEEITVTLDPAAAAMAGLTAGEVAARVAASDSKGAAGLLRGGESDLIFEVDAELDSLARVRETPVRVDGRGAVTRLADVADVRRGVREPQTDQAIIGGRPAVVLAVFIDAGQRVDTWAADARAVLERHARTLPAGIGQEVIFDQSTYTAWRLATLISNLVLGAGAVTAVVFVLMGWRSAVLVGAALPLSAASVFAGMNAFGIPIHQMSVTGLIIALGLLIDNAIVMVDEVRRRLKTESPADAIAGTLGHLAVPLFGSTLTTVLTFLPIALMPGPAGEFVGTIALGVILALVSSLAISLTVIPTLAAWLAARDGGAAAAGDGLTFGRLNDGYERFLRFFFRRPIVAMTLASLWPFAGFYAASKLPEQFFPPGDRDQFQIEIEMPPEASIARTREVALGIRERILANPRAEEVHWFLGRSAPSFYYNMLQNRRESSRYGQALVQMDSNEGLFDAINAIQAELSAAFPEARVLCRQLEQGPPFDAPVEWKVFGPDLATLDRIGERLRAELASLRHVTYARADLTETLPKLSVVADEEDLRRAGLTNAAVARQLDAALEGATGGSVVEATERLPVRVRLAGERRSELASVRTLELMPALMTTDTAARLAAEVAPVPLSSVAKLTLSPEPAAIKHIDGVRMNSVQGFIDAGVLPAAVLVPFADRIEELVRAGELVLPDGYYFDLGGEAAERDRAVGNLLAFVGILGVMMVATLVLCIGSFRGAGVIGVVAFLSAGCGLGMLYVCGYPFGFMAIVGSMGLIGVAINDSIVVLAALREHDDSRNGDPDAVARVVRRETRHVMATTATTVAGFIPLLLGGGGFWPPLAVAIAGGVAGATILALAFVPAAVVLLGRLTPTRFVGG